MTVQPIQKPGLLDAIRRISVTMQQFADAIRGYSIIPSVTVPIGKPVRLRRHILMHPLDVLAVEYAKDPHARLDAAMDHITEKADVAFARARARLYMAGHDDRKEA